MPQQVVRWELGTGATWGGWQPGHGEAEADALARRLADTPDAQDRVRTAVLTFDAGSAAVQALLLRLAVWVPDRASGAVLGTMAVELRVEAPSPEAYLRSVRKPARDRLVKVLHHDSAPAVVAAGQAVVVTRAYRERKTDIVLDEIEWTVFPEGSSDAVQLVFSTPRADFAQQLSDESADIVNRLSVTLGTPA